MNVHVGAILKRGVNSGLSGPGSYRPAAGNSSLFGLVQICIPKSACPYNASGTTLPKILPRNSSVGGLAL